MNLSHRNEMGGLCLRVVHVRLEGVGFWMGGLLGLKSDGLDAVVNLDDVAVVVVVVKTEMPPRGHLRLHPPPLHHPLKCLNPKKPPLFLQCERPLRIHSVVLFWSLFKCCVVLIQVCVFFKHCSLLIQVFFPLNSPGSMPL